MQKSAEATKRKTWRRATLESESSWKTSRCQSGGGAGGVSMLLRLQACREEVRAALGVCLPPPCLSPPLPLCFCSCWSPQAGGGEVFPPSRELTKFCFLQHKPLHPPPLTSYHFLPLFPFPSTLLPSLPPHPPLGTVLSGRATPGCRRMTRS